MGDQCQIVLGPGRWISAEVVGFDDGVAQLMPYEHAERLSPGMLVVGLGRRLSVPVGDGLLGRVLDGLGRPIDGKGPLAGCWPAPLSAHAPAPLDRQRIREPFVTGQRAIDAMLTFGRGQRVGLFSGSGVGKSTLLGEIAKGSAADLNVIALVGERGREVRPFLDDCLGPSGLQRSVVVVATSDQPALMRVRAAANAVAIADSFRREAKHVLLLMDSLTRLAMAQREIGLSLGEPPSARSYTPSVFQLLASTMEQLGTAEHGSITGILTVLVDGDDLDEPISDALRALLDGHIVLDRGLAQRGHFPPIDISKSISRVFPDVTTQDHQQAAVKLRAVLATYSEVSDLIRVGAYASGSSPEADRAIELLPAVEKFLQQKVDTQFDFEQTVSAIKQIAASWPY